MFKEEVKIQKPISGEIETKTALSPEVKVEPKVVVEGAKKEAPFTAEEEAWFKKGEEAASESPTVSPPLDSQSERAQDARARGGKSPEKPLADARAIELKILDLEEEKERLEAMDLTQMVAKVAELTPEEKKAYKKMLKGKEVVPPKGTAESEAAGAELNRIFQRLPQINKELADLRRQLRRAELGAPVKRPEKPAPPSSSKGPAAPPAPEAPTAPKSPEEIEHQNLRVKEQEGKLTEEEFDKLLTLDFQEHLKNNPPIDEIFSPQDELAEIKKLPREEKKKALAGFKEKLARQREGWAACRVFIERSIEFNHDISADKLIGILDQFSEKYGFTPFQREMLKKFTEDYYKNREKVLDIRKRFPDNSALVEELTGLKFSNKDLEVSVGPMSIDIIVPASIAKKIHDIHGRTIKNIFSKIKYRGFAAQTSGDNPIYYSIIVKAGQGEEETARHEREHQKNKILQSIFREFPTEVSDISSYEQEKDPEVKKTLLEGVFRDRRAYALARAKDEIIAMLQGIELSKMRQRVEVGVFDPGVSAHYDYLKETRNYKPAKKDALYQKMVQEMLVKEYGLIIRKAMDSFVKLVEKGEYSRGAAVALLTDKSLQEWPVTVRRLLEQKGK